MRLEIVPGSVKEPDYLLDDNGVMRLLPAARLDAIPNQALRLWCHNHARYGLPTAELIEWLQFFVKSYKAIEIGSGCGDLAFHLGIPATDSYVPQLAGSLRPERDVRLHACRGSSMQDEIVIPDFLAHLPRYAGFPVPVIMLWVDGKPDFRAVDSSRIVQCFKKRQCGICGTKLGDESFFIGGDACRRNHLFLDPAMHKVCAEFSAKICPFLSGQRAHYSERAVPAVQGVMIAERPPYVPENMFLFRSMTKWTRMLPEGNGGVCFKDRSLYRG